MRNFYLYLSLIFVSVACSDDKGIEFTELTFQVNPATVDSVRYVKEHKLSLQQPVGFISLPEEVVEKLSAEITGKREGLLPPFTPKLVFVNAQCPTEMITVSSVEIDSNRHRSFTGFIIDYNQNFQDFAPDAGTAVFSINELRCWQGRRMIGNQIHYRILIDIGESNFAGQYDFRFTPDRYEDVGRILESVIGSFKKQEE